MNYNKITDLPPRYQKQAEAKIGDLRRGKERKRTISPKDDKKRCERKSDTKSGHVKAKNKYGNRKVEIEGRIFDSEKEARRWAELKILEEAGIIKDLQCQVSFELIPAQKIGGQLVERPVRYIADFVYTDTLVDELVVEDVKGYKKGNAYRVFALKRKLMLEKYGIRVKEI